jgi:prepilin signal peptidase PulO-like enzyme (type II secretory pathway)
MITFSKRQSQDVAQAVSAWAVIGAVQDGLGGGVEIVGGWWVLLISAAALRANALPRSLSYLGVVVGMAGILTVAPPLGELGAVFGLGQILWFSWIGVLMLRRDDVQPTVTAESSVSWL